MISRLFFAVAVTAGLAACQGQPKDADGNGAAAPSETTDRQGEAAPADPGTLAPVDAWRRSLAELLPSPWRLEEVAAQVEAPAGWTRLKGSRGLLLTFTDGSARERFWVMPHGFEGRTAQPATSAPRLAANAEYLLFGDPDGAPAWSYTAEVEAALGIR